MSFSEVMRTSKRKIKENNEKLLSPRRHDEGVNHLESNLQEVVQPSIRMQAKRSQGQPSQSPEKIKTSIRDNN